MSTRPAMRRAPSGPPRKAGHRRRRWLLAGLVFACACLAFLVGPAAQAQAKDWRIDNMDVLLDVQQNGDVVVDEKVTFTFQGNYHFVGRNIPTQNMDGMPDVEVRDAN